MVRVAPPGALQVPGLDSAQPRNTEECESPCFAGEGTGAETIVFVESRCPSEALRDPGEFCRGAYDMHRRAQNDLADPWLRFSAQELDKAAVCAILGEKQKQYG